MQTGPVLLMNTEHLGFETKARIAAASVAHERAKGVTEALGAKLGMAMIVSDRTLSLESLPVGTFTLLPDGSVSSSFASREMVVNSQVTVQFEMDPAT